VPSLPPLFRPPHLGPRKHAEARRQQELARRRGTKTERGYDARWERASLRHRRAHPLCVCCKANGIIKAAELVDHIVPRVLAPSLFWDEANWQSLCQICDKRIKRRIERAYEQGKAARAALRLDRPLPEFFWVFSDPHPHGLRPSAIPLTIVCGPPAGGKTTWVAQHKADGDVVIDLDEIGARLSGEPPEAWSREWLAKAIAERNQLLGSLAGRSEGRAWFIVCEPLAEDRQWWGDTLRAERVVVIEAKPKECVRRCRAHPVRAAQLERYKAIIDAWWDRYTTRDGDEVIR